MANSVEEGQGGAIYVAPYEYAYRIKDTEAYKNLKTDETTYFKGNKSGEGLFNPAINCEDFANLQFSENSDVTHEILTRKSLLNNYDVNYKNDYRILTFNANGGHFPDNTEIKREEHEVGEEIQILAAPTKEGYSFDYWKGSQYYPGDTYTVTENYEFVAQWKNEPPILIRPKFQSSWPGFF